MTCYMLLTKCQSTTDQKTYKDVCSDLKYAKPEVNRSTCGFDFSFEALSVPVTFRSVETVKKL